MDTSKIPYTYTVNSINEVTTVTIGNTTYTTGYGLHQANYTILNPYLPPDMGNYFTFHRTNIDRIVHAIILAHLAGDL